MSSQVLHIDRNDILDPAKVTPSRSEGRAGSRRGMKTQKYAVNQYLIESVLSKVREGEIAIPEIQRPFVWDSSQVRDLLDSLYQGFPIGYLIAWRNPDVRLKDGTTASGKMILIDGQQRVTALAASVLGQPVVNKNYKRARIVIAFHPIDERFEVQNPAILKDDAWVPDIAPLLSGEIKLIKAVNQYIAANPGADADQVEEALSALTDIPRKQIGLIELSHDLDIETVTEIFIRINSKGTVLSQADFAMSKIASDSRYGGPVLRKCIDYFSHLAVAHEFYSQIKENDEDFTKTEYFGKMAWLKDEKDDLYDPGYTDILRVAFTTEFNRGRLSDLVSLLSGRNFETKTYEASIAEDTFSRLRSSVLNFINENHFKRFVMAIKGAGFVSSRIRSLTRISARSPPAIMINTSRVKRTPHFHRRSGKWAWSSSSIRHRPTARSFGCGSRVKSKETRGASSRGTLGSRSWSVCWVTFIIYSRRMPSRKPAWRKFFITRSPTTHSLRKRSTSR